MLGRSLRTLKPLLTSNHYATPTFLSQATQRFRSIDVASQNIVNAPVEIPIGTPSSEPAIQPNIAAVDAKQLDNPLAAYNRKLDACRRTSRYLSIRNICEEMQRANVKPDLLTYNILLSAYEPLGSVPESLKLLDDMALAGVTPDLTTYHILLRTCASAPRVSQDAYYRELIFDMIQKDWNLQPNIYTHECYLDALLSNGELERSVEYLETLKSKNIQPLVRMYGNVIHSAISYGAVGDAFELLKMAEDDKLPIYVNMYYDVLRSCADDYNLDGVLFCWKKILEKNYSALDEGACIDILHVAAKFGKPQLAAQVIVYLTENRNVSLESHHLEPLLEAFIGDNDFKQAMDMLSIMRSTQIDVNIRTAAPIVDAIQNDVELIDKAYYALEELHNEGKKIDIVALNSIIIACRDVRKRVNADDLEKNNTADAGKFISNPDVHRAVETYKAAEKLGVTPDVHTFNALLNVCVAAQHRELGEQFWKEMKNKGIRPTIESYRRMVFLCCSQLNDDYEDAFVYLEEMKAQNMLPTPTIYERIIRKCIQHDDARAKIALEEMENFGYKPSSALQDLLRYGGQAPILPRDWGMRNIDRQRKRVDMYQQDNDNRDDTPKSINTKIELNDLDQFFSTITKTKIAKK
ncbi:5090_t:CDS:2 [Acaulospora morrowiae]|uniref:5090_t:CDS:1 n=1 Tax=Acaulospora morrowiae TaxID=94023 RepID=A0A9N8WU20_9GLOM|nr:5090_t:CDS:2 [Acaulospora morrowiae]